MRGRPHRLLVAERMQIHARFTETEFARQYNTVAALLAPPDVHRFVGRVQTKDDNFAGRAVISQRLRTRH